MWASVVIMGNLVANGGGGGTTRLRAARPDPLTRTTGTGGEAQGDRLSGIEDVEGSRHADRLTGDAVSNQLSGLLGTDMLSGGDGDDVLVGDGEISFGRQSAQVEKLIAATGQTISITLDTPERTTDSSVQVSGFINLGAATVPPINVALVVDMSGSMVENFAGSVNVGDRNGDGLSNTKLDALILKLH